MRVYDTIDHQALGQSPREAFDAAIVLTGNRSHRKIVYDQDFLVLTLPTTRKGTAKIWTRCKDQPHSVLGTVGRADYSWTDFVEDVKCACARDAVGFDNDIFNELHG